MYPIILFVLLVLHSSYGYQYLRVSMNGNNLYTSNLITELTFSKSGSTLSNVQVSNSTLDVEGGTLGQLTDGVGIDGSENAADFVRFPSEAVQFVLTLNSDVDFDVVKVGVYGGSSRTYSSVQVEVSSDGIGYLSPGTKSITEFTSYTYDFQLAFAQGNDSLEVNESVKPLVELGNGFQYTGNMSWNSLEPSIASVDSEGNVLGVAPGTARIVAALLGQSDTLNVVVEGAGGASLGRNGTHNIHSSVVYVYSLSGKLVGTLDDSNIVLGTNFTPGVYLLKSQSGIRKEFLEN